MTASTSPPTAVPWAVYRQDDNGNVFLMAILKEEVAATEMVERFTARGHKQFYWTCPYEAKGGDPLI